ncbi:hypothetical protein ACH4TE_05450 [Streptomyces sioyaensis]|uniref:hypothetical protein n=1 Tax=Streptomyces sioyaensis TaxID=67364 RepID=UPI0037A1D5F1
MPDQRLFAGVARLAARHEGRFSPETVQCLLADSYGRLSAAATVGTHLDRRRTHHPRRGFPSLTSCSGAFPEHFRVRFPLALHRQNPSARPTFSMESSIRRLAWPCAPGQNLA